MESEEFRYRWLPVINTSDGCLYKKSRPKCPSSRLWVCGKPAGFSKDCGKTAEPAFH